MTCDSNAGDRSCFNANINKGNEPSSMELFLSMPQYIMSKH